MAQSLLNPVNLPMVAEWNRTEVAYPSVCIHELFEQQVERARTRTAACCGEHQLTYSELNGRANQLANYLVKLGVGPEVLVGVSLTRSLDMLITVLAILKAGGAYVFLDPAYPRDRRSFTLNDSQARLLVTEQQLMSEAPHIASGRTLILEKERDLISSQPRNNPSVGVKPQNLAYVLYTSGSTGKPKGVQIEHRSVVNFLTSMRRSLAFDANEVVLAITTMSFDIAALELFLPLVSSARVIVASREVAVDGEQLRSAIESNGVTVVQATPVTWQLLLDAGWQNCSVKVLCGGEALRRDLARRLLENSSFVWNLYGPTETTIWSSIYRVRHPDGHAVVPIGRPIANTQMHILDSALNPVAIGETGDLYIGGDGLARGYVNRPELTAEKFVTNPFRPGTRLYKTGDLARYLPSGDIEFQGRTDHQVKIRGFRIELGEIEAVLEERSDILHAVVLASEMGGETRLIAYFVANPGKDPKAAELRSWLTQKLPDYMIPTTFFRLNAMPLTYNGKVDRRALPVAKPEFTDEHFLPPRDRLEAQLIAIWERALGRSGIGVRDNFFDLGGYSVVAAKVMQGIDEECGKRLPIVTLFSAPTIEQLAALLRKEDSTEASSSQFTIPSETGTFPAAPVELRKGDTGGSRKSALRRGVNRILHLLSRLLPGASTVRPFLHRLRGVRIERHVFVGDDVYIENEFPECVEIHEGATIGLRTTIVAHTGGAGRVVIGKNAFIGANSVLITAGNRTLTIGEGSVLMAGSVVSTDVSPFTVCGVERAKPLARLSKPFSAGTSYEEFITFMRPLMVIVASSLGADPPLYS
jgi:amino acid adenylation domain-containing protein